MPQRHFQCPLRPARKSLRQIRTVISQNALSRNFTRGARHLPAGIGIENCRKRLQMLFPGRFSLQTGEQDGIYRVRLTIHLHEA